MNYEETNWIRSSSDILCPDLIKLALEWYRPFRFAPRFLQKYLGLAHSRNHKIPVIIQVTPDRELRACIGSTTKAAGCKAGHELHIINSFTAKVSSGTLKKLTREKSVIRIWHDRPVKTVLDVASPAVEAPIVWEHGITGKGIGVAVIDTGIYPHPDLSGRITGFTDFVGNKTAAYDDNGHGTHVAGDIASDGSRSNSLYRGPAPGANLIGVKVLDANGSGSLSTVIKGIQWCIENKASYGIRVINLSLGSTASQGYSDDPVCQAVESAWNAGIVVCAAAGNEGPDPGTISSPGIDPMVITVGATDDKNSLNFDDYTVADYSSRGPTADHITKPDLLCPGTNIISLRSPGSTLDKQNPNARVLNDYISLSGTSMAAPVCAGIVALILEADGSLAPDEVKSKLMHSAIPLPGVAKNAGGSGLADADEAVLRQN